MDPDNKIDKRINSSGNKVDAVVGQVVNSVYVRLLFRWVVLLGISIGLGFGLSYFLERNGIVYSYYVEIGFIASLMFFIAISALTKKKSA